MKYTDLCARLDERAAIARGEKTGTALGDAIHFEQAAAAIRELQAELDEFRSCLATTSGKLMVAEARVAELTRERDAVEALVKAADEAAHALSYSAYDGVQRARANLQAALAAIRKGATP